MATYCCVCVCGTRVWMRYSRFHWRKQVYSRLATSWHWREMTCMRETSLQRYSGGLFHILLTDWCCLLVGGKKHHLVRAVPWTSWNMSFYTQGWAIAWCYSRSMLATTAVNNWIIMLFCFVYIILCGDNVAVSLITLWCFCRHVWCFRRWWCNLSCHSRPWRNV